MPTPVGPVPPDPDDPDLWDWGDFDANVSSGRRLFQRAVISILVLGLVILLLVNIL
jgi:hypothetical protein